jgi:ATP-dependent RNA helicase DeaD
MSEQDLQDQSQSETSRSANAVYTLPFDARAAARFLRPALERVDATVPATQLVVLASDPEATVALAQIAMDLTGPQGIELVPATSAERAARLIRSLPALAIVGPPSAIRGLVTKSVLKLDQLRTIVLAWADDILGQSADALADIEAIMAEVPKEAGRILVARSMSLELEELAERYLRRAPRLGTGSAVTLPSTSIRVEYLTIAKELRARGLRRLLDALDPPSAAVVVHSPRAQIDARGALHALGYRRETDPVQLVSGDVPHGTHTVVLYEPPTDASDLAPVLAAEPARIVALVEPRQLHALSTFLGDQLVPISLPEPRDAARQHHERIRREVEQMLESRTATHELVTLEPLLERYDGLEIAAAILKLLEQERSRRVETPPSTVRAPRATDPKPRPSGTRVFLSVGSRD